MTQTTSSMTADHHTALAIHPAIDTSVLASTRRRRANPHQHLTQAFLQLKTRSWFQATGPTIQTAFTVRQALTAYRENFLARPPTPPLAHSSAAKGGETEEAGFRKGERGIRESRSRSRLRGLKFWKKKRDVSGVEASSDSAEWVALKPRLG